MLLLGVRKEIRDVYVVRQSLCRAPTRLGIAGDVVKPK
jgi:hypothetical protein